MQLGVAVGLALTTVVFNRTAKDRAEQLGTPFDSKVPGSAPLAVLLSGYRAAQWTAFGFSMLSLALVVVFLRGIGKVGRRVEAPPVDEKTSSQAEEKNGIPSA